MKPELQKLFEGVNGLSTDFLDKVSSLLESKVNAAIQQTEAVAHQERLALVEAHQTEIKNLKAANMTEMAVVLDKFLNSVVEEWANKNAVGIDAQIKAEAAERMITGMVNVMKESRIHIAPDVEGQVAAISERLAESERRRNLAESELNILRESDSKRKRQEIIKRVCEGMVDTKVEKIVGLLEGIELKSEQEFETRVITFRTLIEGKKRKTKKEGEDEDNYTDKVGKDNEENKSGDDQEKDLKEGKKRKVKEDDEEDEEEDDDNEDQNKKDDDKKPSDDTDTELKEAVARQLAEYRKRKGLNG